MRLRSAIVTFLLASAAAACGTSTGSSLQDDDAGADADDATTAIDTVDDVAPRDDVDSADVEVDDTADSADVDATAGGPGDPCDDDAECASLLCVDIAPGDATSGFCSAPCQSDDMCPEGFDCVLVTGSVDAERLCVPVDLCIDADGDGAGVGPGCAGPDCDDDDPRAYFGFNEVCDGVDNDCDLAVDDAPSDANVACDTGFEGECASGRTVCETGLLSCAALAAPESETCDTRDNDCDGLVDEDETGDALWRPCFDGDPSLPSIGICAAGRQTCSEGGFSGCQGQQLPLAEVCNQLDDNCDGEVDDGLATIAWYADVDGDLYGDNNSEAVVACAQPAGFVSSGTDCDDSDEGIHPGVAEYAGDGIDSNCDGLEACYEDADMDGYRRTSTATLTSVDADCGDPGEAWVTTPVGDCDDDDEAAFPGNAELCDNIDNDCDRRVDEGAGCYPNGAICVDPIDCASGLCEGGFCVRPLTCVDLGTCPPRTATSAGGGRLSTGRFVLDVSGGAAAPSPVLRTSRFVMNVGTSPYVKDP